MLARWKANWKRENTWEDVAWSMEIDAWIKSWIWSGGKLLYSRLFWIFRTIIGRLRSRFGDESLNKRNRVEIAISTTRNSFGKYSILSTRNTNWTYCFTQQRLMHAFWVTNLISVVISEALDHSMMENTVPMWLFGKDALDVGLPLKGRQRSIKDHGIYFVKTINS